MAVSPLSRYPRLSRGAVLAPKLDTLARPQDHSYNSPRTPGDQAPRRGSTRVGDGGSSGTVGASSYFSSSTSGSYFDLPRASESRKRTRYDACSTADSYVVSPYSFTPGGAAISAPTTPGFGQFSTMSSMSHITDDFASPAPLVNTTYTLAGGVETPAAGSGSEMLEDHEDKDVGFRRGQWGYGTGSMEDGMQLDSTIGESGSLRGNGSSTSLSLKRSHDISAEPDKSRDWSQVVFSIVGGVASKMWDFCTVGAFRGFYAGGGQGYILNRSDSGLADSLWNDANEKQTPLFGSVAVTSVPGQFPSDLSGSRPQDSYADSRPPPAKRQHTGTGGDNDWVFVSHDAEKEALGLSPRVSARKTPLNTPSQIPRLARPRANSITSRPSRIPISRRTSTVNMTGSPVAPVKGGAGSFAVSTPNFRSVAPGHDGYGPSQSRPGTPVQADVQNYMARVAREERIADESLRKMSERLDLMIKQGEAALRTPVRRSNDNNGLEDEGYAEGGHTADGSYAFPSTGSININGLGRGSGTGASSPSVRRWR